MSYDVYLRHESGKTCTVPPFDEGGTRVLGGSDEAELNVTYNYGECYRLVPPISGIIFNGIVFNEIPFGISLLDQKLARDVIPILEHVVAFLGDHPYTTDYWAPTPGNAGHAVAILLAWARLYPDARFEVS
jgi:hypothetical protein